MKNKIKPFICMILSFLSMKAISLLFHLILDIANVPINNKTPIYQLLAATCVFILTFIINFPLLKREIKEWKTLKDKGKNIALGIIIMFAIKYAIAFVLVFVVFFTGVNSQSNNQELVEQLAHANPWLSLISGSLLAPFYEELIYRGSMREYFKHDVLFIISSGLIFGLLHVVSNTIFLLALLIFFATIEIFIDKKKNVVLNSFISLVVVFGLFLSLGLINPSLIALGIDFKSLMIQGFMYIVLGFYLAWYYVKHKNIYLNMIIHSGNNLISEILVLFTK